MLHFYKFIYITIDSKTENDYNSSNFYHSKVEKQQKFVHKCTNTQ